MTHPSTTADEAAAGEETRAAVRVTAPGRLHFGLLSWGQPGQAEFGGVGMMIAPPRVELHAAPAEAFAATGPYHQRVERFAARWAENRGRELPACQLKVLAAPGEHSGLGVGTALGLSVAAALDAACELPPATAAELAACVGRGRRSAIGTHGFGQGGFLFDRGKLPGEPLGKLETRQEIPADWRIVLARPRVAGGLYGTAEEQAFAKLPAIQPEVTAALLAEIETHMLPALAAGDCAAFGESVYRYGRTAGECFAAAQGGPYASSEVAELVAWLRAAGIAGVGQSSWGPTVFAILPNAAAAEETVSQLEAASPVDLTEVTIATGDNAGAVIERLKG